MIKNKNIAPDASIELSKILGAGAMGAGRVMYVAPSTSASYSYWRSRVNSKDLFTTVDAAVTAAVTGQNDILILSPDSHSATSMVSISKNRVHLVGSDMRGGIGLGARSRISMGVTSAATDIAALQNTGQGNSFRNIKFTSSNTKAESIYAMAEGGEYSYFQNCEFYKDTDLDGATAAELLMNGDSSQFENCTFGSTANAISGSIRRPCVQLARETITGKVCRDSAFLGCTFLRRAGDTANAFVGATGATDVERMLLFDNCLFFVDKLSTAVPAQAIIGTASLTTGYVFAKDCATNATKISTTTGVVITGAVPTYATSGIAVAS